MGPFEADLTPHPEYQRHEQVSTFGLITSHNPHGVRLGDRQNFEANGRLLQDIKSLGCEATVIRGMYAGHREESFCIVNIRESDILRLCVRHKQEAAVWGFLRAIQSGLCFDVYYLDNGEVVEQKTMPVEAEDVESKEMFFKAVKAGRIMPDFKPKKGAVAVLSNDRDIDPLPFGDF